MAILQAIKPEYCELIASGKKTIEVRKTIPIKENRPIKVYMYCCKPKMVLRYVFTDEHCTSTENKTFCKIPDGHYAFCSLPYSGKVIGEYIYDDFGNFDPLENGGFVYMGHIGKWEIPDKKILRYMNGKRIYGWHISDLKIYDEPKELKDFGLTRPPQSWCYVKELI